MSRIIKAKAYSNGEVAYISWKVDSMINSCLGFEITRIYPDDTTQNSILPAWVPFKGQSNPDWKPQNTSVWPVQKLSWRDLTLVKKRDQLALNKQNTKVQYLIRPIVAHNPALTEVTTTLPVTYHGKLVKLSYLDEGFTTNIVEVGTQYGDIRATFTNGILATQWLTHTLKAMYPGKNLKDALTGAIKIQGNVIRKYLTGEVLNTLKMLLLQAKDKENAKLKLALYELDDDELVNAILSVKDKVEIILSNTSKGANGWDDENSANRIKLKNAGITVHDRYFNNAHIGHNKFVIYLENDDPKSVMTGSTNWTSNGLCAQSNNAVVIESGALAKYYDDYWDQLKADTALFKTPSPVSAAGKNVQGPTLRSADIVPKSPVTLADGTKITVWFSPNTMKVNVDKKQMPPDLSFVYSLMRKADKAIFFAVFLPGRSNNAADSDIMTNVITEAIDLGSKDSSLLVYGAVSDPTAMPNYVAPPKKDDSDSGDDDSKAPSDIKVPTPTTYDNKNVHIVRAYNFRENDIVGSFEAELYSAGHAIIHDKIVVIDPFSENAAVVFGSHNAGFKASYSNDENLIIVQNNPKLVQAYAVHVLDIYEHYLTRAVQAKLHDEGKPEFDGFISIGDGWLERAMETNGKGDLADYLSGE